MGTGRRIVLGLLGQTLAVGSYYLNLWIGLGETVSLILTLCVWLPTLVKWELEA